MLEELKKKVFDANLALVKYNLVIFTWGNVSQIDRKSGLVVIKPSGVGYDNMTAEDMVVVDLDGRVVEGRYKPSSDTATHIELYKAFGAVGGITHTHSTFATGYAQSCKSLECLGTTHADYFYGAVPCTRPLTKDEIATEYERNTGLVIAAAFAGKDPMSCPAVLVGSHGPFAWGVDAVSSVEASVVLEEIARMATITRGINPKITPCDSYLMDKHYFRKHGKDSYYGQK